MKPRIASEGVGSLDDLELELRKLPGVRAAGFEERDDMLLVQLHITEKAERTDQPIPVSASRIAARHSDRPVAVEVVRWRSEPVSAAATAAALATAEEGIELEVHDEQPRELREEEERRARLLAVLAFPDTDELEVHLILEGKRTIGRAAGEQRPRRRGRSDDRRRTKGSAHRSNRVPSGRVRSTTRTTTIASSSPSRSRVSTTKPRCSTGWPPARARSTPRPGRRWTR